MRGMGLAGVRVGNEGGGRECGREGDEGRKGWEWALIEREGGREG